MLFISILAVIAAISALIVLFLFQKKRLDKESSLLNREGKCLTAWFHELEYNVENIL